MLWLVLSLQYQSTNSGMYSVYTAHTSAVARTASRDAFSLLLSAAARLSCCFIWPSRARASAPHVLTLSAKAGHKGTHFLIYNSSANQTAAERNLNHHLKQLLWCNKSTITLKMYIQKHVEFKKTKLNSISAPKQVAIYCSVWTSSNPFVFGGFNRSELYNVLTCLDKLRL